MIPLRRYLMVDEHAVLPFPEGHLLLRQGLIVGDKGGRRAIPVLIGGGAAAGCMISAPTWSRPSATRSPGPPRGCTRPPSRSSSTR